MKKIKIELKNLFKKYPEVIAVDDLNIGVEEGKIYSLLGPSGCGKTTTLRMIAGFEKPTQGDIFIEEKRVNDVPPYERNLGMFFQNYALFPHKSVFDNVAFGLKMRGINKKEIDQKVKNALAMVQLSGYGNRGILQLSGGQQQRVALARCLVIEPAALLLDEPLSNLDKKLREEMQIQLKRLQEELKITTIFVTHNQEEAMVLSDQVVVMNMGKMMQIGTPHEIYHRPNSKFVADFIGTANIAEADLVSSGSNFSTFSLSNEVMIRSTVKNHKSKRVNLILRPESLELLPPEKHQSKDILSGVLENIISFGSTVRYFVKLLSNNLFFVDEQGHESDKGFKIGDKVSIKYDPNKCWLVED